MLARAFEERMPRGSRRVFERSALVSGARSHVLAAGEKRPAQRIRKRLAERLVAARVVAQLMVEMCDAGDGQLARRVQFAQQIRERHRVAAARHGQDEARARSGKIVSPDGAPDDVDQH